MITLLSRAKTAQPLLLASFLSVLLNACGGGSASDPTPPVPPATTYTAKSGVAQKGPLIKGSTVTAQELDSNLSPNGKQYSYQTISDLGTFSPTSTFTSQYIGVNATGYYFDELLNALSTGPVTLNGYSDLAIDTVLNVNVLTTLAYQRIQNLVVNSHLTFTAARAQAESEVLTALNIPPASYGSFSTLDLGGSTDGDHILAAISSIFVYGNAAGSLSVLIGNFQSDLGANGVITTAATKSALAAASKAVNTAAVAANLTQEYASLGVTFTPADITQWIDQDGDGVVGKFKFQMADATPSSPFTFPAFVVNQIAGSSVSVTAGQLLVNGTPVTGSVTVQATDVVAISPGAGDFPNGVLTAYLLSGTTKTARVSFVSGLLSIAVTPNAPSVALGLTQQFKATGTFSDTSTADLTSSVTWTSGSPANGTINLSSGLAQTLAAGPTIITATSGSVSGSSTLNVTAAILESFVIVPNPAYSGVGLTNQLTATATYSDATTANVTTMATWTSSTPSVASVGPTTGLVSGVSLGSTTISATIGTLTETGPLSITANVWHPGGSLTTERVGHTATLLPNGVVMVAGGENTAGRVPLTKTSAELYDSAANAWSQTGSMANSRDLHTATLLSNGKVLVAGGENLDDEVNPTVILTSAELYDPLTNSWSFAGSMSTPRAGHTATLLSNGKVLVAGGTNQFGNGYITSAELYDPVANTWSPAGNMATAREGHTATLLSNGKVLVPGGLDGIGVTASAELYDPVANTWSPAGSMATARYGHTATLLANGKVLVPGGAGASGEDLGATELYDPVANTWSPAGTMATSRANHIATRLLSGKVLVAGGQDASAELYDPVTNAWSATGSMATARSYFTATLLSNGVVLAVGGLGGVGSTTSSELYW
jgi:N-acetylneuraminic acid mutarotase